MRAVASKANSAERAEMARKLRRMTPGAAQIIENLGLG
jgi:hypothetical protein